MLRFQTRRSLLRGATRGGAALAAAAQLPGVVLTPTGRPRPTRASQMVELVLQVSWQGATNYAGTAAQALTDRFLAEQWLAGHPGVRLTTQAGAGSNGPQQTTAGTIDAVLAGDGPDIIVCCCDDLPGLFGAGVLRPIDDLISASNVDLASLFSPTRLDLGRTAAGLMGLPDYGAQAALYWNQGLLDELGLAYPSPEWSYLEAAHLWRQIAGLRNKQWVYGSTLPLLPGHVDWLVAGFGGQVSNLARTECLLDSPQAQRALEWLAPLSADKVVVPSIWQLGNPPNVVAAGQAAFASACCGTLQSAVLVLGDSVKWDFIPLPTFPTGRVTRGGDGLYGINQMSKNPVDLLWDLYLFVTTGVSWQRFFNGQLALEPPALVSAEAWDDWMAVVRSVAPVLRTKNLEYVRDAALGQVVSDSFFAYSGDQATAILTNYLSQMESGKLTVQEGLAQAVRQVNALEAAGVQGAAQTVANLRRFDQYVAEATASAAAIAYPAPPAAGSGDPGSDARALVTVAAAAGRCTVRGAGAGVSGYTDACTFTGSAFRLSRGAFACRLIGLSAVGRAAVPDGATVGLMARASLTDGAPNAAVAVVTGSGVNFQLRPVPDTAPADQSPAAADSRSGLIGSSVILAQGAKPVANYLLRPVWLKLLLEVDRWTAYSSLDGAQWTALPGGGLGEFVGAWVGLFATSGTSGQYVQAVFDHLTGFEPDVFVRFGSV